MKTITMTVEIQFDADQITEGNPLHQAYQAAEEINLVLQREPYGLAAQIMGLPKDIKTGQSAEI